MKDQLVNFETAKLAKEKGFNVYCDRAFLVNTTKVVSTKNTQWECLCPTQSLLQKWLREVHTIHVVPVFDTNGYYYAEIYVNNKYVDQTMDDKVYEEALENGLQEALTLVKNES